MIEFRPATSDDLPFLIKSWLKEYRGSLFANHIDSKTYYQWHHEIIERILKRAVTVVAHPIGMPSSISGFLIYEKTEPVIIHYCYTRFTSRNLGVARCMIEHAGLDLSNARFTHEQRHPMWIYKKYPGLIYCPYAI